jgi:YD repeat-containing protein
MTAESDPPLLDRLRGVARAVPPLRVVAFTIVLLAAVVRSGVQPTARATACDTAALTNAFGSTFALGSRFSPVGGISLSTGWFRLQQPDVEVSSPLGVFSRAYNSGDTRTTSLGPGWTSSAQVRLRGDGSGNLLMTFPDGAVERFDGAWSTLHGIGTSRGYRRLDQEADHRWVVLDDGRVWTFESTGSLARVDDPSGDWVELRYDGDVLKSTVGPDGPGLEFEFGAGGRLSRVSSAVDPAVFATYEYDAIGRLSRVVPAKGPAQRYTYLGQTQQITTITDDAGSVLIQLDYDERGRVIRDRDGQGLATGEALTVVYEEDSEGSRTTVTYPVSLHDPVWHPVQIETEDSQFRTRTLTLQPTSWARLVGRYDWDRENRRIALDPKPCPPLDAPRPDPGQVAAR